MKIVHQEESPAKAQRRKGRTAKKREEEKEEFFCLLCDLPLRLCAFAGDSASAFSPRSLR
jgi:hypothetical protein